MARSAANGRTTGRGIGRWNVTARILAAVPANYLVTSLATACLARLLAHGLSVNPAEASVAATLLSFALFATIALLAFGLRSAGRLWLWLAVSAAVLGGALWLSLDMGGRL
ncbi:hypothetical protein ACLIMP_08790 [Novosphingobium aerophilum]|uniref:hypothetical protein n=1 Tax=Novosphingobium TaxID=165696 RepID=UPI002D7773CA|nr:hypothetical protein [Novosphingobium sp. RL4]WRT94357.1 hypothetical protein U9J33_07615 [Novosphingobium sp. RL4]